MGMFDTIEIDESFGLPETDEWQTKSTTPQNLDRFKIDKDGNLLHEAYDLEDRSDPDAQGIMRIVGISTRINKRIVQTDFRGDIIFYTSIDKVWWQYSALFDKGKMLSLERTSPAEGEE